MGERFERWILRWGGGEALGCVYVLPLLAAAAALLVALTCAGCGAGAAAHHARLNMLTDVADPTYELAVETCDVARDMIVEREGTTEAEDRRDMARVNEVCDGIVSGFEALRGSQVTARAYIDQGLGGAAAAAVAEGFALWGRLRPMLSEMFGLTSGGES